MKKEMKYFPMFSPSISILGESFKNVLYIPKNYNKCKIDSHLFSNFYLLLYYESWFYSMILLKISSKYFFALGMCQSSILPLQKAVNSCP